MEKLYIHDAKGAGVDVTSSFEGREGTSVDVFHFRHLQLAAEASTFALEQRQASLQTPDASRTPSKQKRQKTYLHPYGSGDAWR